MNPPVFTSVGSLEVFLRGLADSPGDEAGLTELEHLLQCADVLRATAPDDVELQLAGLLHDIGYTPDREAEHGLIGAAAIAPILSERIGELVRLHVDAKRYLVAREPAYREGLSPVSVHTLALQGGGMSEEEAGAFEAHPLFNDALRLRRADEQAKIPGKKTSSLDDWLPALRAAVEMRRIQAPA